MSRAAQIYKFTTAALGIDTILADGGFYKVLSATGDIQVTRSNGSRIGPIKPGQGEREEFQRLTISDLSGEANSGYILVADSSFEDTRVYGQVEVIDGGQALTMAAQAYAGWVQCPPSVGNFSHCQLWNSNTTKHLAVSGVSVATYSSATSFQFRWNTVALSTLYTSPNNKKLNFGYSAAELRQEAAAAALGTSFHVIYAQNNTSMVYVPKQPLIIPPGVGLIVNNSNANGQCQASFDFTEFEP